MMKLLTEETLATEISAEIAKCGDVRVAVAFWGKGGSRQIGLQAARKCRILCNLRSGACNPDEIAALRRRKKSVEIRTHDRLHAKVYWTPKAVAIGSSNVSTNGLAISPDAAGSWAEANVFSDDPALIEETGVWFDDRWKESLAITDPMLEAAREKWNLRSRQSSLLNVKQTTLLAAAKADPEAFRKHKIYLAIYTQGHSADASKARKELRQSGRTERLEDGSSVSFKDAELYEDWNGIPEGAWLVDCDLKNARRPRVWGIRLVPTPMTPIVLPEGDAVVAFRRPSFEVAGQAFKLPPAERQEIEQNMRKLFRATPKSQLLHISKAALLLSKSRNGRVVDRGSPRKQRAFGRAKS